jgi:ATP synthase subunit 6
MFNPLEQFEIQKYIFNSLLFFFLNNANVIAIYIFIIFLAINYYLTHYATVTSQMFTQVLTTVYTFIFQVVKNQLKSRGIMFFPIFLFLFVYLGLCNIIGMFPYAFTITSHFLFTFALSFTIFIGINIVAFSRYGLAFFGSFLPKGVPLALTPFIVLIEMVSYIFRLFSLAIRLFANMTSGHILIKILAGFTIKLFYIQKPLFLLKVGLIFMIAALMFIEFFVALLQTYVFTILNCIYLKDGLYLDQH